MQRVVIAVLFSLVSLMTTSCSKIDAFFRNGEPVTEERNVGQPFSVVTMYHNVNVTLAHDSHPHLELNCPKNLIGKVTTEISNDTLVIKNENNFNWIRSFDYSIDLIVYYDSLRSVNYCSIAKLRCSEPLMGMSMPSSEVDSTGGSIDSLRKNNFVLRILEGSGDINLSIDCHVMKTVFRNGTSKVILNGYVGYAEHYLDSYGTIRAQDLSSNIVKVVSKSTNDIYVWPRSTLMATLHGIGNVYYKGHPWIDQNCTSDGRVIPLE